jgi:hypothetical protein
MEQDLANRRTAIEALFGPLRHRDRTQRVATASVTATALRLDPRTPEPPWSLLWSTGKRVCPATVAPTPPTSPIPAPDRELPTVTTRRSDDHRPTRS